VSFPPLPVGLLIRPLALADLPGLLDVQRSCYGGGYVESAEVFAQRIACPTQCSLVLEVQGRVMAYLAAYDSMMGKVTQLHGEFEPAPHPDTLYLHDLAVLPELGGQGMAARLLHTLWQGAQRRGLQRAALVSVQGSQGFWQHHGYVAYTLQDTAQRERLAAYGRDAVYMMRRLDSAPL
jgi:ribosomal protein S18 acetylase RimI-like enzyme